MFQTLPAALTDLVADYVGCRHILRAAWPSLFPFEGLAQPPAAEERLVFIEDALKAGAVANLDWLVAMHPTPDFEHIWPRAATTVEGCMWLLRWHFAHTRDADVVLGALNWNDPVQVQALYRYNTTSSLSQSRVIKFITRCGVTGPLKQYRQAMFDCKAADSIKPMLRGVLKGAIYWASLTMVRYCIDSGVEPEALTFNNDRTQWGAILDIYRRAQPDPDRCLEWLRECLDRARRGGTRDLAAWLRQARKQIQAEARRARAAEKAKEPAP